MVGYIPSRTSTNSTKTRAVPESMGCCTAELYHCYPDGNTFIFHL